MMLRKRNENYVSLKTKMIVLFLAVIIIPILTMSFNSYFSSKKLLENKYTDLLLEISRQSNIRIEEYLNEVKKISLLTSYGVNSYESMSSEDNYPIQNFLKHDSEQNEVQAYRFLRNYILLKDSQFSIYVYNMNGGKNLYVSSNKMLNYDYTPVEEPWFKAFLRSSERVSVVESHRDMQKRGEDNWSVSIIRKILDMDDGSLLGIMVVSIDIDFINKVNGHLQDARRSSFTIINDEQKVVYNSDYASIGQAFSDHFPFDLGEVHRVTGGRISTANGKDYIITYMPFENQDWTTVLYMPLDELSFERAILKQNLLSIGVILIIFAVVSSFYVSTRITRPIKKLMQNMKFVESGTFDRLPSIQSNDEIGMLVNRFNRMSSELKRLVERIHTKEKEKAELEISALQAQINPHFLYNTLNSVKWIASLQRADKIVEMTDALISMLRYTTNKVGRLVTIKDEIENIKHYIVIQKVRYYNRFEVEFDIDPQLTDYRIPKLTIQPIVENAIFHGISESKVNGLIKIRVARADDDIEIMVADNGVGVDAKTLQSLQEEMTKTGKGVSGIGIVNVNSRIKRYFGSDYGIRFQSEEGKGTTFFIKIPATKIDEEEGTQ